MSERPIIAIPARFSASASALRFGADVTARALLDAVWAAGGEPVVIHPVAPVGDDVSDDERIDPSRGFDSLTGQFVDNVASRVAFADAILLPGGGDVSPVWTGDAMHATHYDVDVEQDAFDFALARVIVDRGVPALAICRGMQLLNVALGGTLHFDMDDELAVPAHRHRVEWVEVDKDSRLANVLGAPRVRASCFHHQCLKDVAPGWRVVARSSDGVTEAVELDGFTVGSGIDASSGDAEDASAATSSGTPELTRRAAPGARSRAGRASIVAVQWHPEDTHATDPQQAKLFTDLVERARQRA